MAHTLDLHVVAEGVKNAGQLDTLRQGGCDLIQGFYFSRPVRPATSATFLSGGKLEGEDPPISSGLLSTPQNQESLFLETA